MADGYLREAEFAGDCGACSSCLDSGSRAGRGSRCWYSLIAHGLQVAPGRSVIQRALDCAIRQHPLFKLHHIGIKLLRQLQFQVKQPGPVLVGDPEQSPGNRW